MITDTIDASIRALRNGMLVQVLMCFASVVAVVLSLYAFKDRNPWMVIVFAVGIMLFRLNAGRYLVLRQRRKELIAMRAALIALEQAMHGLTQAVARGSTVGGGE